MPDSLGDQPQAEETLREACPGHEAILVSLTPRPGIEALSPYCTCFSSSLARCTA